MVLRCAARFKSKKRLKGGREREMEQMRELQVLFFFFFIAKLGPIFQTHACIIIFVALGIGPVKKKKD